MAQSLQRLPEVTRQLVTRQLERWPEHGSFLERSFAERTAATLAVTEETARQVSQIAGDRLDRYCDGYRWMCDAVLAEELFFRRHGRYQATSFDDVYRAVYSDASTMRLYMDGLLLSQVFWRNHVDVAHFYRRYLDRLPPGYSHLEIGPGHGLLLAVAAVHPNCADAAGWDISAASLEATAHCLERMGVTTGVVLQSRNINDAVGERQRYASVVLSEILEHLEDPERALAGVRHLLAAGGRAFINVPCNSPAPDHLYLFDSPEHFFSMLRRAGFRIEETLVTPSTGWTLERALRHKLAISCAAIVTH